MNLDDDKIKTHTHIVLDKIINIISLGLAYHFSMDGTYKDEDTGNKIYSNIFKTIDILLNAWLMIEKNLNNQEPILDGLDLEIQELKDVYDNINNECVIIKNNDLDLHITEKKITKLPLQKPKGIYSKDLLLPYKLSCNSEVFMNRFIIEKNNNLIFKNQELNQNFNISDSDIRYNCININFHPAQLETYTGINYSEGKYCHIDQIYFTTQKLNKEKKLDNDDICNLNFKNINHMVDIDNEKYKRIEVYKQTLEYFGYEQDFIDYNIPKINFENYPKILNYMSLILSYYGIYEFKNNKNFIKGYVDIIKHNLIGFKNFKLKNCKFIKKDIKIKSNNIISNKVYYKYLDNIKDILFLVGNYKKNYQFMLSAHNNLIISDVIYNNKNASIYEVLEEFGNQSNIEYIKLWNNFDKLIKEHLLVNNFEYYEIIKSEVILKKDQNNYEYKSNFRDFKDFFKRKIIIENFSNFMRNIKKIYEDIQIPVFSENENDKQLEKNFPPKFRGKYNYNKLFRNRRIQNFNYYQEVVEDKIISN